MADTRIGASSEQPRQVLVILVVHDVTHLVVDRQ